MSEFLEEGETVGDVLEEFLMESHITCRECGLHLDLENTECPECGWKNPVGGMF